MARDATDPATANSDELGPPRNFGACEWWLVGVTLALLAIASLHLAWFGTAVAFHDDLTQVFAADPTQPVDFGALWSQHNEHRIPLPRLVFVSLLRWTRDFRTATVLDLGLLMAACVALLGVVRRVRGHSRFSDAFLPFVLLSLGQYENLHNGFQVAIVLPAVLALALVGIFGSLRGAPSARCIALVGVLAVALVLSGAFGLVMALCAAVWLAWIAVSSAESSAKSSRARALAGVIALAIVALSVAYLRGLVVEHRDQAVGIATIARVASQFLAEWTGELAALTWPMSGIVAVAIVSAGLLALSFAARLDPNRRYAWLGLLLLVLGGIAVSLAVGRGRGDHGSTPGFASRYATLSLLAPVALFVGLSRSRSNIARAGEWILCALAIAGWTTSIAPAVRAGQDRVSVALALELAVHRGIDESKIADTFGAMCYHDRIGFRLALRELDRLGLPPFWRPTLVDRLRLLGREPSTNAMILPPEVFAPLPVEAKNWRGFEGLAVSPRTTLTWPLPARPFVVRGRFEVLPAATDTPSKATARFIVEVRGADGIVQSSHEFSVDATVRSAKSSHEDVIDTIDRRAFLGPADFAIELEGHEHTSLVLRFEVDGDENATSRRGFWSDVRLR